MNIGAIDLTNHFQLLFNLIYDLYNFLNSLEFTVFGYTFTYLGVFISFVFLVVLIKFLKFGFEVSISSEIEQRRSENKKDRNDSKSKSEMRSFMRR